MKLFSAAPSQTFLLGPSLDVRAAQSPPLALEKPRLLLFIYMPTTPDALPGSRITEQASHRHTDLRPDQHSHLQPALPQVSLREWHPPSHAESGCCGHSPSSLTRFPLQDHPAFRLSHLRTAGAMPSCLPSGSLPWFLSYLPVCRESSFAKRSYVGPGFPKCKVQHGASSLKLFWVPSLSPIAFKIKFGFLSIAQKTLSLSSSSLSHTSTC